MTDLLATAPAPARAVTRTRGERRWDAVRWVLLVFSVAFIVAVPISGDRHASWTDVRSAVAAGQVHDLRVSEELPPGATGSRTVSIRWRHGLLSYVAEVTQVRGDDSQTDVDDDRPVVRASPARALRELQPGLVVSRDGRGPYGSDFAGFTLPDWVATAYLLLTIGSGVILFAGPTPWRATRGGWFWMLFVPFGAVAFVLLSGPRPWGQASRVPKVRLTGGWSFLLLWILPSWVL